MSITTERIPTQQGYAETLEVGGMPAPSHTAPSHTASSHTATMTSVTLIEPMAGFEGETAFSLSPIDDAGLLQSLRSASDPDLRFVLSPAGVFYADYLALIEPIVAAPVADALGTTVEQASLHLYVLLTVGQSLLDTTANLRAPIVIDHRTGKAIQVILDDDALAIAAPLPTD